jgi:ketosteroid isomerase-like protein
MTENDAARFVEHFKDIWASGKSERFLEVWHEDGELQHVLLDRIVRGKELPALHTAQLAAAPDLRWTALDWAFRGDTIIVEFQNSWTTGSGQPFAWRGVDVLRLRDGKIVEERVYADTAPLRAARAGKAIEPIMKLEPAVREDSHPATR